MSGCRHARSVTAMAEDHGPEALIRRFYAQRRDGDPEALRPFLHADVIWREPEVRNHMGELRGADAVIDMMRRALLTTGGSFALDVGSVLATANSCSAIINWSADKSGHRIHGRELAVFRIQDGLIGEAWFLPEAIADDHAFWA